MISLCYNFVCYLVLYNLYDKFIWQLKVIIIKKIVILKNMFKLEMLNILYVS